MRMYNQVSFSDFEKDLLSKLVKEIKQKDKQYILGVDETQYIDYLFNEYVIEALHILEDTESVGTPKVSQRTTTNAIYYGGSCVIEVYTFTIKYGYTGSGRMFAVTPNPFILGSFDLIVDDNAKTVSFSFELAEQDPQEFNRKKAECYRKAFVNLKNINANISAFNNQLRQIIANAFHRQKEKYLQENKFFEAINIKVNPNTQSVFTAPTIKKKVIPKPVVPSGKHFTAEPTMSTEMLNDVLKVIYDSGKSMEKKPGLYVGKDEEALREQFLFVLETRYEGTTASGETFNRSGKTDILLKYSEDGSNLFVAECKFWHGAKELLAAISQLFGRYLTWRDSKAALLLFVKTKNFSQILNTIKAEIRKHECFIKEAGNRGESSFSYLFCLPQDRDKHVMFEVMAFHYDK